MISVIIIFFNPGAFLQEAIESVLAQTDSGWELLLVDDGSLDQSTSIARSYARMHPDRIRYLQHPERANLGMSASRNLGLRYAKGDLISFLDADDIWFPNKLKEQRALLETEPSVGMLVGKYEMWYSWRDNPTGRDSQCELPVSPDTLIQPPQLALACFPIGFGHAPSMSDLIVRRRVVEQVGSFEDRFRGMYEDQAFLMKVYLSTPIYVSSNCWSKYRQHELSCCYLARRTSEWENSRSKYLFWLETYLQTRQVDGTVHAALRKALWPYRYPRLNLIRQGLRKTAQMSGLLPVLRPLVRVLLQHVPIQ